MAEKLKRLMEAESLPTPTLESEKRQEYTSTLHKVVGTGAAPPAATPTRLTQQIGGGGGGGGGEGRAAPVGSGGGGGGGHLTEDPSLYQHPEDPGAFNLQYSLWSIGSIGLLMRSSTDAILQARKRKRE